VLWRSWRCGFGWSRPAGAGGLSGWAVRQRGWHLRDLPPRPSFAACIYIATASPGDQMTSLRRSLVALAATDSASGRRSRATRSLRRAAGPRQAVASPESCAKPSGHASAPTGDCGIPEQVLRAVAEQPLIRPHPDLVSSEPMGIDLTLLSRLDVVTPSLLALSTISSSGVTHRSAQPRRATQTAEAPNSPLTTAGRNRV
jgi:hypothetical protein